jgi:hypothetical protein
VGENYWSDDENHFYIRLSVTKLHNQRWNDMDESTREKLRAAIGATFRYLLGGVEAQTKDLRPLGRKKPQPRLVPGEACDSPFPWLPGTAHKAVKPRGKCKPRRKVSKKTI